MTQPSDDRTVESIDDTDGRRGFERRPLLKALGAGATLSLGGIAAASDEHSDDQDDEDDADDRGDGDGESRRIDPVFGFPTTDAATVPENLAPDHEVELTNAPPGPDQPPFLYFDPVGLRVDPGEVVQFSFLSPDHTVTAMHPGIGLPRRVPENAEPFSSPVMGPGAAWLYRFEHRGVYDIYCAPHLDLGMVMRIVVGDIAEEDVPEYAQTAEALPSSEDVSQGLNEMSEQNEGCEWPFLMPAGVLGTDALHPTSIRDADEVPFETVVEELGYELVEEPPGGMDAPTVQVAEHPDHGEILVDSEGMTLYMFDSDEQGAGESTCHDDCVENWPPLTVEQEPTAGEGVEADLTVFEREDGSVQVAANGWPLHYFAPDDAPGDAAGQGVGDVWWVLDPSGTPVRDDASE